MIQEQRKLYSRKTIEEIKRAYDFRLTKSLGQNFLLDKNIIDKIVEGTELEEGDLVIEIGPGIGVLTRELAAEAKKVLAIEIDKNLIPILEDTLGDLDNIEVINQDILKVDLGQLIQAEEAKGGPYQSVKIVGNLPYYITTPIVMKILEEEVPIKSITVMMQKEVAERIKEGPGTKVYGALSVGAQFYCKVEYLFTVPKDVFHPTPKVDSAVIRLDRREEKLCQLEDPKIFWQAVKHGFSQRRKTLENSLVGTGGMEKPQITQALQEANVDTKRRAETLSIEEFGKIANIISGMGKRK